MKRKIIAAGLCGLIVTAFAAFSLAPSGSRVPDEDQRLKGSYRFERNGWVYVHLEGAPERVGYQHGYLLAQEIEDLLRVVKPFLQHETKHDWEFYRRASQDILWPKIDIEFQNEIDGIVK